MPNIKTPRTDADHAFKAWRAFHPGGDDRESITDLITELLHLIDSDRERFDGYDGGMVQETAVENYYEERDDGQTEPDPETVGAPSPFTVVGYAEIDLDEIPGTPDPGALPH